MKLLKKRKIIERGKPTRYETYTEKYMTRDDSYKQNYAARLAKMAFDKDQQVYDNSFGDLHKFFKTLLKSNFKLSSLYKSMQKCILHDDVYEYGTNLVPSEKDFLNLLLKLKDIDKFELLKIAI